MHCCYQRILTETINNIQVDYTVIRTSPSLIMNSRTSAQDVIRCDLCETAVVQMHCDTCLVNLCKACVGEHASTDPSKPHKIVDFKDRKFTTIYPNCRSHNKEKCKMYCKQCNIPVCINCLESNQHLSHELSKFLQALDEKKDMIIKERNELNDTIYPTYQDIASDVQKRMRYLEKDYGDLATAIKKHGDDLHREVDKLVEKLKAEVDEMKNMQLQTLQKHLDEINKSVSEIKNEIDSIDVAVDSNDISKLFSFTSVMNRHKDLPGKIVPNLPKFAFGRIQGEELGKLFGSLSSSSSTLYKHGYRMTTRQKSPETGSSPPIKQLLDEPEIATTIETGYGYLYNVACLNDEDIWTSGEDRTMKLFSINQGSLLQSITTKSGNAKSNIAVTKGGDLVYTDTNDRTVNIVKNEKIEEVIRLQEWRPKGVCSTSSGDLLVIMDSKDDKQTKVVRYSGSIEKQTIQFDDEGKPLYSPSYRYLRNVTENKNLNICVADDGTGAVVVVNQAGKPRFRYTGHISALENKPFYPRGITTDSQSRILIADMNNDCVHIIDQDGQFLRYIDCGLTEPWGLCTDTNDNLFVAQWENKQVKKIKYLT
ncbi:tripartite motif-containing protein 2-like [Saccostrea cucullata]|uniref:tripartite motif-containing protein 2-like n=1 Tax=Saccostrea cuccullata TaxID=36930 RepID=UPI002ED3BE88